MLQCIIIALAIFLLLKIISLPIRLIWKLAINTACGFACLVAVNLLGPYTGVLFDLNLVTAPRTRRPCPVADRGAQWAVAREAEPRVGARPDF